MLKFRPRYLSRREWRVGDILDFSPNFKILKYIKYETYRLTFIELLKATATFPNSFNVARGNTEPG